MMDDNTELTSSQRLHLIAGHMTQLDELDLRKLVGMATGLLRGHQAADLLTAPLDTATTGTGEAAPARQRRVKRNGKGGQQGWVLEAFKAKGNQPMTPEQIYQVCMDLKFQVSPNEADGVPWVRTILAKNRNIYHENPNGTWERRNAPRSLSLIA